MAESEGFEPPNGFPSPDFEKSGLAATPPRGSTTGDLNTPPRHAFYEDALDALLRIQRASRPGLLPDYDRELLEKELRLFPDWYIARQLQRVLERSLLVKRLFR